MGVKITDKDRGYKAFAKRCKEAEKGAHAVVGILAAEGAAIEAKHSVTVLQIAQWHEFGAGKNPERSFIRAPFDANESKLRAMVTQSVEEHIRGGVKILQSMGEIGSYLRGEMVAIIATKGLAPNAPSTIKKKGSDTPLIDTGLLKASITYVTGRGVAVSG